MAWLGIAWALLGLVEAIIFAELLAPHFGDTFTFESWGKRRPVALHFDTISFSVVGLVSSSLATAAAVIGLLVRRRTPYTSMFISVLAAFVVPILSALALVNGVMPVRDGNVRADTAAMAGTLSLIVAAGTVVAVPFIARHIQGADYISGYPKSENESGSRSSAH